MSPAQSRRQDIAESLEARKNRVLVGRKIHSDRASKFAVDETQEGPGHGIVIVERIIERVVEARLEEAYPPVGVITQPKRRLALRRVACNPMFNLFQKFENMIGKGGWRAADCRSHKNFPQLTPNDKLTNCRPK